MHITEQTAAIEPIVGTIRAIARARGLTGWADRRPFGAQMQTLEELMQSRDIALEFRMRQHRALTDSEKQLADRVAETIVAASRGPAPKHDLLRRRPR